jgi:hypothetical protein
MNPKSVDLILLDNEDPNIFNLKKSAFIQRIKFLKRKSNAITLNAEVNHK